MALNITGADSLFIQEQPHINKQAGERDGLRLNRSGHAGPAAVFSFSQQALDSAKDAGRSQVGMKHPVGAATATFRAEAEHGARPVETAAALPAPAEATEAFAAKADPPPPLGYDHELYRASNQPAYRDLLDHVPISIDDYFS